MKIRINILSLLLALTCLYGCSADESPVDIPQEPSEQEQVQVVLNMSVPEVSLPFTSDTRAITDDKAINNLAVWVFDENDKFLYQLTSEDKDSAGNPKIVQRSSGAIYMLLPKSDAKVTLALMANVDITSMNASTPSEGTDKSEVWNTLTFNYSNDIKYIPMYGESGPIIIDEGVKLGTIRLERALAKVEVDIEDVLDNFILDEVTIVNANTRGTVAPLGAKNLGTKSNFTTKAKSATTWVGYIPEALMAKGSNGNVTKASRVSLVLKGTNKKNNDGQSRYYRLDFITHRQTSMEVAYDYITTIERNKRYTFKVEYVAWDMGSLSLQAAIDKEKPDNHFFNSGVMTISNEAIRDITTDDQYYLGVTSPDITAVMDPNGARKYYTVNMSVVTNNPEGWWIEDLPDGVTVNTESFTPSSNNIETVTSIWVYIDKNKYTIGETVTLYVYCGHFRKSVQISIKEKI